MTNLKEKAGDGNGDENRDLGFGSRVSDESQKRLLNQDGSFNVARTGLSFWASLNPYHALLTMSWSKFLGSFVATYFITNAIFAIGYLLCGPGALLVPENLQISNRFWIAFFFSVDTMATIGYGNITPVGMGANWLVTIEALFGILSVALVTGILFARFSRPTAKILFSENIVIAPYRGITALEFRITNTRRSQIIQLEAKVLLARFENEGGKKIRQFVGLDLERQKVVFFPLSWTLVHPIDESSPLFGVTEGDLLDSNAEVLILLSGIDETFSQLVHTRSSYQANEIIWQAKFNDVYNPPTQSGRLTIDVRKLHSIELLDKTPNEPPDNRKKE